MIHQVHFRSAVLGTDTYFLIAAPEGAPLPLPGVVLFRGVPEEWLNPAQDETRQGRTLLTVMADLIHKGYSRPLAFILPRTANGSQTAFVGYGHALRPDLIADRSFLGTCRMDDFVDEELLPMAFASGLVVPGLVAIDGFSLGGAAAIQHALRRPDAFSSLGAYDGALLDLGFDDPRRFPGTPSDLRFDWFPYLYGYPPDEAAFRRENALDRADRGEVRLPPAMIHHAAERGPTENGWRVQAFVERAGLHNHAAHPTMGPRSRHTWWWNDEHLYRTLPFHAHHLYGKNAAA